MPKDRFRRPKYFFTQISNYAIDDERISPQAYYIYSKIQRYITLEDLPVKQYDFEFNKAYIRKRCNMGDKTFDKYWKELCHLGYLKTYQMPDLEEKGQWITEYELLHEADLESAYFTQYNSKGEIVREIFCPTNCDKTIENTDKITNTKNKTVKEKVAEINTVESKNTDTPILGGSLIPTIGKEGVHNNIVSCNINSYNINSSSSKDEEEVITFYKDYRGIKRLSKSEKQLLLKLIQQYNKDVVLNAINIGIKKCNKPNFAYIESICINGVFTGNKPNEALKDKSVAKINKFTQINEHGHNWDFNELEKLEQEYIERKLHGDLSAKH